MKKCIAKPRVIMANRALIILFFCYSDDDIDLFDGIASHRAAAFCDCKHYYDILYSDAVLPNIMILKKLLHKQLLSPANASKALLFE